MKYFLQFSIFLIFIEIHCENSIEIFSVENFLDLRSHLSKFVTIMNEFNLLLPQCQPDIDIGTIQIRGILKKESCSKRKITQLTSFYQRRRSRLRKGYS